MGKIKNLLFDGSSRMAKKSKVVNPLKAKIITNQRINQRNISLPYSGWKFKKIINNHLFYMVFHILFERIDRPCQNCW